MEEKKNNQKNQGNNKAASAEEAVTLPIKEHEALLAKCKEAELLQDKYLRAHAEFENARRRIEKDKIEFLKFANEGIVIEFLPILDNLEIAERHIKEAKDFKAVQEGVDMIQNQIQKFMKDIGVERIKAVGEKFDPHLHEAIETAQAEGKEEGTIIEEMQPGYRYHEKLLRPALVKIVKK